VKVDARPVRALDQHLGVPTSIELRRLAQTFAETDSDEAELAARALLVYDCVEHLPAVISSRIGAIAYRLAQRLSSPVHVGRAVLAELRGYVDADLYHREAEGSLNRHRCFICRQKHDACCTGEVPCPPEDMDPMGREADPQERVRCVRCTSEFVVHPEREHPLCVHCRQCILCVPPWYPHAFQIAKTIVEPLDGGTVAGLESAKKAEQPLGVSPAAVPEGS